MGSLLPHAGVTALHPPPGVRRGRAERKARVIAALRNGWERPSPLVFEVNRLLSNSPVDLGRIEAVVESDAAMARAIWSNCASVCGTAEWAGDSLDEAVVLLGIDRFRFAVSTHSLLGQAAGGTPHEMLRWFWERSFRVGCASDRIGRWLGHSPAEYPFLAGLLHDVGMLPLMAAARWAEVDNARIRAMLGRIEWERKYFGLDHCVAGGLIAIAWELPERIADALVHHHDPAHSGDSTDLLRIVAAAEEIVAGYDAAWLAPRGLEAPGPPRSHLEILAARLPKLGAAGARHLAAAIQEEWSHFGLFAGSGDPRLFGT